MADNSQKSPLYSHTTSPFRVRYQETDRMGRVYYAEYLVWLEMGRTDLLRNLNTTYAKWENENGVYLPVCDCQIKYVSPAEYDDLVTVETRMMSLTKASVRFEYTIRSQDNQERLLAKARTTHAFIGNTGKIIRVADQLLPQFFSNR